MRLDKPIGFMLLFWPCAWGFGLSLSKQIIDKEWVTYLLLFFIGSILMRSAGCVYNDIIEDFEKFVDKISSVAEEVKVIENFALEENDDFEVEESENTMSILNRYIDEAETELDKSIIKKLFETIYREACEVE